jgi:GMP synthase-like glutamine amidotransferase
MPGMKLCILDNDELDPLMAPAYGSYAAMFERLLRAAGWQGEVEVFQARRGQLPDARADHDAVLLTGSRADAFSDEDWVVALRRHVEGLLRQGTPLLGVCFGHQLIAHCLGARVQRAPQGWGSGRMVYDWHAPHLLPADGQGPRSQVALLASHQDQVLSLPRGATLLASSEHCPVAGYVLGTQALCLQPHPEFDARYSAYLLGKRREQMGEAKHAERLHSLQQAHDGPLMAALMVRFIAQGHSGAGGAGPR